MYNVVCVHSYNTWCMKTTQGACKFHFEYKKNVNFINVNFLIKNLNIF